MDDNYPEDEIVLDPRRDHRLRELMELRDGDDRPLTPNEDDELEALSQEMARALIARHIEALAREHHIPTEEARAGHGGDGRRGLILGSNRDRPRAHGGGGRGGARPSPRESRVNAPGPRYGGWTDIAFASAHTRSTNPLTTRGKTAPLRLTTTFS